MSRLGKFVRAAVTATAVTAAASSAPAQGPAGTWVPPSGTPCVPGQTTPLPQATNPLGATPPLTAIPDPNAPVPSTPAVEALEPVPSFASTLAGAGLGETAAISPGGYIDNATPVTMFRLRFDSGYGNNRPDRAEYFYAKCGCFKLINPPQLDANGPPIPETNIDYQELRPYFEYALAKRFSVFATIPIRFLNPTLNANATGLGDIDFGAKYALIYRPDEVLTFQTRVIAPSGELFQGLGSGNWWVQPGLLYLNQVTPLWSVFGEVNDQINVSRRSDFTGNVMQYGIGTSHIVLQGDRGYVAPVLEVVGWTALSGKELTDGAVAASASGDTIVNAKFGVRLGIGRPTTPGLYSTNSDFYIGYGRALTGEVWYKDMLRLEFRKFF